MNLLEKNFYCKNTPIEDHADYMASILGYPNMQIYSQVDTL